MDAATRACALPGLTGHRQQLGRCSSSGKTAVGAYCEGDTE